MPLVVSFASGLFAFFPRASLPLAAILSLSLVGSPQTSLAHTPSNIDLDTCIRVCRGETDTLSWQPSQQNPGPPPSDGEWQDDSDRDRTLEQMAKVIIGVYENGKPDSVAPPIPKDKDKPGYQHDRCERACRAAFSFFDEMNEEEFCEYIREHNHFYKRFWKNDGGTKKPGSNPPGYSKPNKDGSKPNPPAPDWDREKDTKRDTEKYIYDNGTGEWVEVVFPVGIP